MNLRQRPVLLSLRAAPLWYVFEIQVLAGYDGGLDPRQPANLTVPEYSKMVPRPWRYNHIRFDPRPTLEDHCSSPGILRVTERPPRVAGPRGVQVTGEVRGLRVGVVHQGLDNCQPDVKDATLRAAAALEAAGAHVEHLSIPMHADSESQRQHVAAGMAYEHNIYRAIPWLLL